MPEIIIPMITPFRKDKLDRETLRKFVSYAYENGFDGLFPGGSTGGFASLSLKQHKELLSEVIEESSGMSLFAGICRNNVEETLDIANYALELGYHNLVSINPYYHKYSEESTKRYFDLLLSRLDADVYIYNNPSLSGSSLSPSLVARLRENYDNLAGMKDSGNDFNIFREFLKIKGLKVYQGKDAMLAESIKAGASGGVCSTANFCLNTLNITRNRPGLDELSAKTVKLVQLVGMYEVPPIHNYLFRRLILGESEPKEYMNSPFVDLKSPPDLEKVKEICVLPP